MAHNLPFLQAVSVTTKAKKLYTCITSTTSATTTAATTATTATTTTKLKFGVFFEKTAGSTQA